VTTKSDEEKKTGGFRQEILAEGPTEIQCTHDWGSGGEGMGPIEEGERKINVQIFKCADVQLKAKCREQSRRPDADVQMVGSHRLSMSGDTGLKRAKRQLTLPLRQKAVRAKPPGGASSFCQVFFDYFL
jgi:hypothetical protein